MMRPKDRLVARLLAGFSLSVLVILVGGAVAAAGEDEGRRMRLMVLPAEADEGDPGSVEEEAAGVIVSAAVQLGRFEVIDRHNVRSILREHALQLSGAVSDSMVVDIGNLAAAREALVVRVLNFSQKGVPPSEDPEEEEEEEGGGWSWMGSVIGSLVGVFTGDEAAVDEPYGGNVQTVLSVEVRKIDVETGRSLQSIPLEVAHTGGTHETSRAAVMGKLRRRAVQELKELYLLTSEVISVEGNEVLLGMGTDLGLREGMLLEIVEPNRRREYQGRSIAVPGRTAGFVAVSHVAGETSRSEIQRQWRPIEDGHWVQEQRKTVNAFQLDFLAPVGDSYLGMGFDFVGRPVFGGEWGIGGRVIRVTDSSERDDLGIGCGAFGGLRLWRCGRLGVRGRVGVDLDLPMRIDHADHRVWAALFSPYLGIDAEILLSRKSDLVLSGGYRFGGSSSTWRYGTDEGTLPGVWVGEPPEVDISGPFLKVGYRFLVF